MASSFLGGRGCEDDPVASQNGAPAREEGAKIVAAAHAQV
jgi:hypothetical protein